MSSSQWQSKMSTSRLRRSGSGKSSVGTTHLARDDKNGVEKAPLGDVLDVVARGWRLEGVGRYG
jgi:hypothetical protein